MKLLTPRLKRILTLAAKVAGVFLFLAVIGYFSLRGYFLNKAIEKVKSKLNRDYHVHLQINEAGFSGLSGVSLKGIQMVPDSADTLLVADEFTLRIKFLYALLGDIRVSEMKLSNGYFQLTKRNNIRNFAGFMPAPKDSTAPEPGKSENQPKKEVNYAKVLYNLINSVLNKIPGQMEIAEFTLKGVDEEHFVTFSIKSLTLNNGSLNSSMVVVSDQFSQNWKLSGTAYPGDKKADLEFMCPDTGRIIIPYLNDRFNLQTGFNAARLTINNIDFEDDELQINGAASIKSFLVNHPKISSKDVVIDRMEFNYDYRIGRNYISLDSSSVVNFNGVVFHPFVLFQNGPDTIYHLVLRTEKTEAQQFIDALPEGLFSHIKGMQATGSFTYRLDFRFNENHPDDMIFESSLEKDQFHITRYGEANLAKLNEEFTYIPLEKGRPMRPISVGPSNPYFAPLDQISELLRNTVLTTEDPSFFYHRGFVTEAFRQSIAKNIRTGKFKRGASTISMQLMKNVFLTREKTMARKLEEILLVYILENNYICNKNRMYEVYLNIIEWGPNVYGIGEACEFYYRKKPSELTLSECLFLATIIPSPKHFMWRFNKDGSPKPYLERSYRYLATKMIARNLITPTDTIGLTHFVSITGPARNLIIKSDTLVNDTLIQNELIQIENQQTPEDEDE